MLIEATASIAADHPALAGHFPGSPVVPGALLLDAVISAAETKGRCRVREVLRMKFHRPLGPDTAFSIRLRPLEGGRLEVACGVGAELLLSGLLRTVPGDAGDEARS